MAAVSDSSLDQRLDGGEVRGVHEPDLQVGGLALQLLPRRQELVQRRIEQTDDDRKAVHRPEDPDEVVALELEERVDRLSLLGG